MQIISGATETLPINLYARVASYRHQVFVEQMGWPLHTENGMESDQFDRSDTMYMIAQDDQGRVPDCTYLLPTVPPINRARCSPIAQRSDIAFIAVGFGRPKMRSASLYGCGIIITVVVILPHAYVLSVKTYSCYRISEDSWFEKRMIPQTRAYGNASPLYSKKQSISLGYVENFTIIFCINSRDFILIIIGYKRFQAPL